jgi:branched-chain amino acid transport system substrate-binding protein
LSHTIYPLDVKDQAIEFLNGTETLFLKKMVSGLIRSRENGKREMNFRLNSLIPAIYPTLLILLIALPFTGYSQIKDKIRIGTAISLSGPYAPGAKMTQTTNYDLWVDDVNAKGGIFVKSLNKRLPVELITYDDKSDVDTGVGLLEKLILEDKVDLLLPPWGTAMNFALAPVANKYGYPFIGISISSEKLREMIHTLPYFFVMLNQPREQGARLVEILKEFRIKKVAIIYVADLHDTMLITEQAKAIGLNPKVMYLSVGVAHPTYRDKFGAAMVDGVMGPGAWNRKSPYPGVKEYVERYIERYHAEPDWWGGTFAYGACQVMQQAVEIAGTLDREKIRDVIAKEIFPTVLGPVKFDGGFNIQSPGDIGQWQRGTFEVIAPKNKRTAPPLFPKPPWPK